MRGKSTIRATALLVFGVILIALASAAPAGAQAAPPLDGSPASPGLGPTYGEEWCAPVGSENVPQSDPLALIPYGAIRCTLDQFEVEAEAAEVSDRLEYLVIGQSTLGRDIYGVVVNSLETAEQQRDYDRWLQLRGLMMTNPAAAQSLLASWGPNVKLPIFVEANIHGGEREGTDAMMQVVRDLVTLPYGVNDAVDELLDHAIVVVIPTTNPDGRVAGRRTNENAFDLNRDFLVQSQPEVRANTGFQLDWLAPVALYMHGYYNPTLVDGLTKPHNPGLEYDKFLYWNQRRLDANDAAIEATGRTIQRPVNDWDERGRSGTQNGNPAVAEGWDDWGPFYSQTYGAFFGVDGSTVEMCNDASCGGRLGSKREQYVIFYSSAGFWVQNRSAILNDQLEIFRRGVAGAARPNCCDDPLVAGRGFTEDQHNWMVEYPKAFLIPFQGTQRSDGEANRVVQWLLDNGIAVQRTTAPLAWQGTTYPAGSYVVSMRQALRGFAYTALTAGQDVSQRISQLYAPPGAWSHGLLWGADVLEVAKDDASFNPSTVAITSVNPLQGGVRSGPADWYAVALRGKADLQAALGLLRSGVDGEMAEAAFTSASAGAMPAGSLIFASDAATVAALQAFGSAAGIDVERGLGPKPARRQVGEAPKVAILVNSSNPGESDTTWSLRQIFGSDVGFVSTLNGASSLQNAAADPLAGFDVIYNTGQQYPSGTLARNRLRAFFQRGGGYIATGQSAGNFAFLNGAHPSLVKGSLTQGGDPAGGGIALWNNAGSSSPLTGGYAGTDNLFLPSNVNWFSTVPTGAAVDGRYLPSTTDMFLAGLWLQRDTKAAGAPVIVHGTTLAGSRYLGFSANPFSRGDAEREWLLIGQAALWTNLTDE